MTAAGDVRCSRSSSFGSSGEMVDRAGARTATEEEVGTERGGGGGGGADVGVAGGIVADNVALRRAGGGGLKISSSKDGERTRFRFVFEGAGCAFGVDVVVVVVVAGVFVEAREAGAATAATSEATSGCGGDGGAAERALLAYEMLAMVPRVAVSSVQRVCWRFLCGGGESGGGDARLLRVRFGSDLPTFAAAEEEVADERRSCLRSTRGGSKGDGGSAGGFARGLFAGVATAFGSPAVRFSSALRGR